MIILFCCFIIVINANLTPERVKLLQQLQKQRYSTENICRQLLDYQDRQLNFLMMRHRLIKRLQFHDLRYMGYHLFYCVLLMIDNLRRDVNGFLVARMPEFTAFLIYGVRLT